MLLFDNILFATLIPQLLMFLGLVTCFTESYLSSFFEKNIDEKELTITLEYSEKEQNHDVSIIHFDDFTPEITSILYSNLKNNSFEKYKKVFYPNYSQPFHIAKNSYVFFSRPPPVFT